MPDIDDLDEYDVDTYDQYVGASVQLSIGDKVQTGKVARGKTSVNPILDTRTYNVEFPDGRSEEYTANGIADNIYAQCDEEENQFVMLQDIVKLLPLPHPPVRARTDARTNPSAQRATQLRSVLARVYAVSRQNQITTTVP
jgi:hypothetical protein